MGGHLRLSTLRQLPDSGTKKTHSNLLCQQPVRPTVQEVGGAVQPGCRRTGGHHGSDLTEANPRVETEVSLFDRQSLCLGGRRTSLPIQTRDFSMAGSRKPGPLGQNPEVQDLNAGTMI